MKLLPLNLSALMTFSLLACARETVHDAAQVARKLVENSRNSVGSMATVFPSDDPRSPGEDPETFLEAPVPNSPGAMPFSLPEYYASCHQNGSLTLLFLPISRHSRNILQSEGQTASISITSPIPAAARPRVALIGNVTVFKNSANVPDLSRVRHCYLSKHPDATQWLPDDDEAAHIAYWARFDPHTVYFVGGFGDEHYIGYIPVQLYQAAWANTLESGAAPDIRQQVLMVSEG
ncbi:hypothetical protein NP233_g3581 [Leucocoprinus birnbaumii]|uniref:CREG-like beta-barrel domain-containing protein n=1 Tax=Leucocoprinus birnbaumii TaxID=56174 RepID=A0AAD5VYV5_9AGAR|nr:hypothetical protein NP233_g3581 [Leucocoprinus birnbaumii]